jgi:hypothetical protein
MPDIKIPSDSGKYKAGAGDDLEVYNDGSHSYISNTHAGDSIILATRPDSGSTTTAVTIDKDQNVTIAGNLTVNKAITFNETSAAADFRVESDDNTHMLFVDGSEDMVAIGHDSPEAKLDVVSGNVGLKIGGDVNAETLTNDTRKYARFTMHHYHNAEEGITLITGDSDGTDNIVAVGGMGSQNASTQVRFYTAANDATTTGTERMRIPSVGGIAIIGDFHDSATSDESNYQISFGGDAVTSPRWGFRVATSSNDEDLYLDRNLSGTPAVCMAWDKVNGNVGIGTSSPTDELTIDSTSDPAIVIKRTNASTQINKILTDSAGLYFQSYGHATGGNNQIIFMTEESDSSSSPTERMRITSGGEVAIGHSNPGAKIDIVQANSDRGLEVNQTGNNNAIYSITGSGIDQSNYVGVAEATDYTSHQLNFGCYATASDSWNLMIGHHGDGSSSPWSDVIFNVEGNGDVEGDGSYSSTAGDYAEYFESKDGKAIPVGTTVKLDNGKLVACSGGETPIGVIRPKQGACSVIGNKGQLGWSKKYKRDDYGGVVLEDNNQQYSDDYDSSQEYIPREKRDEWNLVGLLGQVQITKGQPMSSSWVKMWDVSDTVEMWFVK